MVEVDIARQYRAMKELVSSLDQSCEDLGESDLRRVLPSFVAVSCYTLLSGHRDLPAPFKGLLLDHALKLSGIRLDVNGFEMVLVLDVRRHAGALPAPMGELRGSAEYFWSALLCRAMACDRTELFGDFLLMFKLYIQAVTDDLNLRNPDLHLSAAAYLQNLERM